MGTRNRFTLAMILAGRRKPEPEDSPPCDSGLNLGPPLRADKLDQVAALAIGSRVKVDPWSDRVELLKTKPAAIHSAREKMAFEVTPFLPFLTRYSESKGPGSPEVSGLADEDVTHR